MVAVPLLHVTQVATRVTTLDGRVAAVVATALIVALALIWRDHLHLLLRPRIVSAIALRVAVIGAFFALLPVVFPYDHLFFEHAAVSQAEEAAHSMHCHLTPGACADAPISAGPGQLIFNDPLLFAAPLLLIAVYVIGRTFRGRSVLPDLRPPII